MDLPYLSYQSAIFHPFISTSHGQEDMKGSKEASGAKKRLGGEVTWEEDWSFIPWWVLWGVEGLTDGISEKSYAIYAYYIYICMLDSAMCVELLQI